MTTNAAEREIRGEGLKLGKLLGSFKGFNFRTNSEMEEKLTAEDVVNWDKELCGEAWFWPSGDSPQASVLWEKRYVTAGQILALEGLVRDGEENDTLLRVQFMATVFDRPIEAITEEEVQGTKIFLFRSTSMLAARKEAAIALFERYFPRFFKVWKRDPCDVLTFQVDQMLEQPHWIVEEHQWGEEAWVLVFPILEPKP